MPKLAVNFFTYAAASNFRIFGLGVMGGAGFTLFKIYFSVNGANYYSVYKKNQLKKELDNYETHLMELDQILRTGKPATIG